MSYPGRKALTPMVRQMLPDHPRYVVLFLPINPSQPSVGLGFLLLERYVRRALS